MIQIHRLSQGTETGEVCTASTLKNAFKKAKIRDWQDYRITQIVNGKNMILFDTANKNCRGYD